MKKYILLSLLLLFSFIAFSQKKKPENNTPVNNTTTITPNQNTNTPTTTKKDTTDYDIRVYANAISLGDFYTAITAIHYKYAKDSNVRWLDTLSRLYFTANMIRQTILTAEIVTQKQPNNTSMLEILALSYSGLGDSKSALSKYEKLFELTQKPYYQYQCAVEEFNLGRVGECEVRIKSIQSNPAAEKEKININIAQGQAPQQVSIKAASLNLLGVMQMKLGKNEDAKKSFEASLKLAPDFVLPKGNLESLNKPKDKK